jgi:hypothetical protein
MSYRKHSTEPECKEDVGANGSIGGCSKPTRQYCVRGETSQRHYQACIEDLKMGMAIEAVM